MCSEEIRKWPKPVVLSVIPDQGHQHHLEITCELERCGLSGTPPPHLAESEMLGWALPGDSGTVEIWEALCGGGREAQGHDPVAKTRASLPYNEGGSAYLYGSSQGSPRMNWRVRRGAGKDLDRSS